jgi:hypothetical protein
MASVTIQPTLNLPFFTKLAQLLTSGILHHILSMHQNSQPQLLMTLLMMISQHSFFIMTPHHPHHTKSTILATNNAT